MIFTPTPLTGSYIVELNPVKDDRGWFARTYCKTEFHQIGHNAEWVQLNHSFTIQKGSIRGMHFQYPPFGEIKMIRCIAGIVFDVIVDIRKGSSTFGKWFGIELSAENKKMLYIPKGFAHGFQTLTDNCELIYHHSEFYQQGNEGGIKYNDPMIGIKWYLPVSNISEKDNYYPSLNEQFKGI